MTPKDCDHWEDLHIEKESKSRLASAQEKKVGMGELDEKEEKGKGASDKEMCNEGQGKVRNKKATATGLSRTVCLLFSR